MIAMNARRETTARMALLVLLCWVGFGEDVMNTPHGMLV